MKNRPSRLGQHGLATGARHTLGLAFGLAAMVATGAPAPAQSLFLDAPSARRTQDKPGEEAGGLASPAAREPRSAAASAFATDGEALQGAAQNLSLGRLVWTDSTGRLGVVWLDADALPFLLSRAKTEKSQPNPNAKNVASASGANASGAAAVPRQAKTLENNRPAANAATAANPSGANTPAAPPPPAIAAAARAAAAPVRAFPLLAARDAALTPLAVLRIARFNPGERGAGLVAVRGTLRDGAEIFLPSPDMLAALERTFPENTPAASAKPASAPTPVPSAAAAPVPAISAETTVR